jgi:predicted TIM-barrel fold metal-dependent hydrolase
MLETSPRSALLRNTLGAVLLAASFQGPALAADAPAPLRAPRVDYHQHLLSPEAARRDEEKPLPAIELPADLSRLLQRREQGWDDKAALADLYTEDSLLLDHDEHTWLHGRDAVTTYIGGRFARPYRITPVSYSLDGNLGTIVGYFTRGEGASSKHFGNVHLSLKKGSDGAWRIAAESPTFPGPVVREPLDAKQLVALLDEAGIERAVVLSTAYWFGSPLGKPVEDEHAKVKAENDWTAQQVALYPKRLVGFCSFNPLKDYAVEELERCSKDLHLVGLKLHFGNSGVDVKNPEHVEKLKQVFRAANRLRMPITAHLWTLDKAYGQKDAEIFLSQILPEAPDVPVQIAHMAGAGPGYNTDAAMKVYADAVEAGDPRTKNLYFDVATVITPNTSAEEAALVVQRMRQVGIQRILYGSDSAFGGNLTPRQNWGAFRGMLPLTDAEFQTIERNVMPYLR